ncbi:MAG: hypothetical protein C0601_02950 [Candidatus Muiribacterium halophilum]|uniref:Protein BatD n=1 Tax=Muiribacterium halophilum TaxID=2053465 RepID=A0A2N5ZKC4_MUIH1|nr:MAG: hypothetical protein C0601_02950 [Candidatus Muirbacterium halophilum]
MVKIGRKSLFLIAVLLLYVSAIAGVSAQLFLDQREVVKGRAFKFTIEVKGDISNVSTPDITVPDSVRIIYQSKNQSINIVNWEKSVSHSYIYSAIALKEGDFSIGPVSLKVDGKDVKIKAEDIKVVKTPSGNDIKGGSSNDDRNVLSWIKIDKDRCYVGEQIPVKVIFAYRDTRVRNLGFEPPKDLKDFITYDRDEKQYTAEVKGKRYNILQLTYPLIPLRTGKFVFDDAQITYDVIKTSSNSGPRSMFDDSFFDDFFNPFDVEKRILIPDAATVEVVSVPDAPPDFSGGVGNFVISVKKDNSQKIQGEPFELELVINGVGNIDNISKPIFNISDDYSISFTGEKKDTKIVNGKITGSKKFSYVVIPEESGNIKIDPAKFVYFDPDKDEFITIKSDELNIKVKANKDFVKKQNTLRDFSDVKTDMSEQAVSTGADIEFIFTKKGIFYDGIRKILLYLNAFMILLFIVYFLSQNIISYFKSSHEVRLSKTIKRLEMGFENGSFYKDFSNIYLSYLSDLLNLKENKNIASRIMEELHIRIKDKKLLDELKEFKDKMELKAYSGMAFNAKEEDLKIAVDLLRKISSKVRRSK